MIKSLASFAFAFSLISCTTGAMAQNAPPNVVKELAPSGTLRLSVL